MSSVSSSLKILALGIESLRVLHESRNELKIALDRCESRAMVPEHELPSASANADI